MSTTNILDLNNRIDKMAEKVTDSGWVHPSDNIYYCKKNGFVFVKVSDSVSSSGWETKFTLPEGCRPPFEIDIPIYSGDKSVALGMITTSGDIQILGNAGASLVLCITFPVD